MGQAGNYTQAIESSQHVARLVTLDSHWGR